MTERGPATETETATETATETEPGGLVRHLRDMVRNDQLVLSLLALVVGVLAGGAVVGFREGIALVQSLGFGTGSERLFQHAATLPWWQIVAVPTIGGLVVGLLIRIGLPGARPQGVADVIEASALKGGRMSLTDGLRAAIVNATSIGVGASVGREGPAVHLGAAFGAWVAKRLHLRRKLSRTLLGCGVAAAVAASFNAPIAGALFANEVVVGHYALKAFAPIVIASVTGAVIAQMYFGDVPAFVLTDYAIESFWEFPAFIGLGIASGLVALLFMRGIAVTEGAAARLPIVPWLRPAVGGLIVGVMAIFLPQILGVGYGATEAALLVAFPLTVLVLVAVAKIVATAVSLGFGFGGGVFSPALVIGAMIGGVYGVMVTGIFPDLSSGVGAYTLVGMGAVAAAVLGAPISTTLIVFEMTGDYKITSAVMVAVVIATVISRQFYGQSFFTVQLERRGLDLKAGFEMAVLRSLGIGAVMSREPEVASPDMTLPALRAMLQRSRFGELFVVRPEGGLYGTITLADLSETAFDHEFDVLIRAGDVARLKPPMLALSDTLEDALKLMHTSGEEHIAVVRDRDSGTFLGCVHERDVMAAYSRALLDTRREERGED